MKESVWVSLLPLKTLWGNRREAQKLLKGLFRGKTTSSCQIIWRWSPVSNSADVFKLWFLWEGVRQRNRWQKAEIFLIAIFDSHNCHLNSSTILKAVFHAYVISKDPKQFIIDFTSIGSDLPSVEMQLPLEWKAATVWDQTVPYSTATVPDNLALDIWMSCGNHSGEFREVGSHFITEEECGR